MAENDSEFIGNRLTIFVAVFTPLQLLTVVLRFYARSLTAHRYGVDDWLVMAALLGQFVATGIAIGQFSDNNRSHLLTDKNDQKGPSNKPVSDTILNGSWQPTPISPSCS